MDKLKMKMNKLEQIQKELAKKGYDIKRASDIKVVSKIRTGIFALDYVLDGGLNSTHRLEFWGEESSGKTLMSLYVIKRFQELNKVCVYIDAENSWDNNWAKQIGIDTDKLLVINVDTLEQFGDLLYDLIKESDLIVVDSIIALIPEAELDRATNEPTMALNAKVNSLICKKMNSALAKNNCVIIFVNQLRESLRTYGSPYTTSGGRALLHSYDTRIQFKGGQWITDKDKNKIGKEILLHCNKNRKGMPHRVAGVDFYFDGKLDNKKSLFFAGVKYGVIKKTGSWFEYNNIKAHGKDELIKKIKDWNKLEEEIWKIIMNKQS